jgi:hypothetical protein
MILHKFLTLLLGQVSSIERAQSTEPVTLRFLQEMINSHLFQAGVTFFLTEMKEVSSKLFVDFMIFMTRSTENPVLNSQLLLASGSSVKITKMAIFTSRGID